jgi:hypothetical protein
VVIWFCNTWRWPCRPKHVVLNTKHRKKKFQLWLRVMFISLINMHHNSMNRLYLSDSLIVNRENQQDTIKQMFIIEIFSWCTVTWTLNYIAYLSKFLTLDRHKGLLIFLLHKTMHNTRIRQNDQKAARSFSLIYCNSTTLYIFTYILCVSILSKFFIHQMMHKWTVLKNNFKIHINLL